MRFLSLLFVFLLAAAESSAQCDAPGQWCWRGGGDVRRDCHLAIALSGEAPAGSRLARIECNEGDPRCDSDPDLDNGSCTVRVGLCINNARADLDRCQPSAVQSLEVKVPALRSADSSDQLNRSALESAASFDGLGLSIQRGATLVFAGTTNAERDVCQSVDLTVPLRRDGSDGWRSARQRFRLRAISAEQARDDDAFAVRCRPSRCGNGAIDDNETCDDGNRDAGDGCAPWCAVETPSPAMSPTATHTRTGTVMTTFTRAHTPTRTPTPTEGLATSTPTQALPELVACGNASLDAGEDCDDGGLCIGGSDAGQVCSDEDDCHGNGACEGGLRAGTACDADEDCIGSRCRRCTPFGGDGCAANCTNESRMTLDLIPGIEEGADRLADGTSGAVIHTSFLDIPLPAMGHLVATIGSERNGLVPIVVKSRDLQIPAIPILSLACGCIESESARSCGGLLFEEDGVTRARDCTNDETVCAAAGKPPCAEIHGPGNALAGNIGCNGITPFHVSSVIHADAVVATSWGDGGAGSVLASMSLTSRITLGACTGTGGEYGADGQFCSADDPPSSLAFGGVAWATTGDTCGTITGESPEFNIGPYCDSGSSASCIAGGIDPSGLCLATTVPSGAVDQLGDVVTNIRLCLAARP